MDSTDELDYQIERRYDSRQFKANQVKLASFARSRATIFSTIEASIGRATKRTRRPIGLDRKRGVGRFLPIQGCLSYLKCRITDTAMITGPMATAAVCRLHERSAPHTVCTGADPMPPPPPVPTGPITSQPAAPVQLDIFQLAQRGMLPEVLFSFFAAKSLFFLMYECLVHTVRVFQGVLEIYRQTGAKAGRREGVRRWRARQREYHVYALGCHQQSHCTC